MYKIFFISLFFCFSANAKTIDLNTTQLQIVKGKKLQLSENEGLLFLSLESDSMIGKMRISPVKSGKDLKFVDVPKGKNHALIKLKEGTYYWESLKYYYANGTMPFKFKKDEHTFKIEAGVINYPGSWSASLNFVGISRAYISLVSKNNFSSDYKILKQKYPTFFKQYSFKFQGKVEDKFLEYYQHISADKSIQQSIGSLILPTVTESNNSKERVINYDKSDGVDAEVKTYPNIEKYLKGNSQTIGDFSPNGKYLLYSTLEEEMTRIEVLNINTSVSFVVYKNSLPKFATVHTLEWVDNDTIYFQLRHLNKSLTYVSHLKIIDQEIVSTKRLSIYLTGELIDALPEQNNFIYFANNNLQQKTGIYKLDTSTEKSITKTSKKVYSKLKKFDDAVYWLTDKNSEIRFIITMKYKKRKEQVILEYWFLPKGTTKWQKIKSYTSFDDLHVPEMITSDDKFFLAVTNKYGDKKSIHKYSTKDFEHMGVFYEDKKIDIEGISIDPNTHEVIGVAHIENGFFKYKYIKKDKDILEPLLDVIPNTVLYTVNQNTQLNIYLLFGINEYTKGTWYLYMANTKEVKKLFDVDSEYNQLDKGVFYQLNIQTKDGLTVEGYFVTPQNIDKNTPLIVIPHGGPIGTRDYAFSNEVQHFYASKGFASLKINYRGSSGFGKAFQESGQQQWGEKIESDINDMVDYVIKNFEISDKKVCAMGSSYGGYSALMLTLLYADRYQCAVSFAGVSDIPLLFSSSQFKENENLFSLMSSIAGNPEVNYQGLANKSPVYLAHKMTKPIRLFHGLHDTRVLIEHSYRMKQVLDLFNSDTQLIILNNEGHSLNHIESKIVYFARALDFISEQLLEK